MVLLLYQSFLPMAMKIESLAALSNPNWWESVLCLGGLNSAGSSFLNSTVEEKGVFYNKSVFLNVFTRCILKF